MLVTTISTTEVQAAIQSNPNTHDKGSYIPSTWMTCFRNMEIAGE